MSVSIATRHLAGAAWNRAAKLYRRARHWAARRSKQLHETRKHTRAQMKHGGERGRDAAHTAYARFVRTSRYWTRLQRRTWPTIAGDLSVRRTLRAIAAGSAPILVGPWLSEVGDEALYWVP